MNIVKEDIEILKVEKIGNYLIVIHRMIVYGGKLYTKATTQISEELATWIAKRYSLTIKTI